MHKWRLLLLPFSWIFGVFVRFRNLLYDLKILPSFQVPLASITVGNLRVGGTGKTPMTIYLGKLLENHFSTAIISRGYGRETKGYKIVELCDTPQYVGDEPVLIRKNLLQQTSVVVSEKRKEGFLRLMHEHPKTEVVIFDDAFQHRKIQSGLSILLTEFDRPYWKDKLLPAGFLREPSSCAQRADILIITKSPEHVSDKEKKSILAKTNFSIDQVFFSSIVYTGLIPQFLPVNQIKQILLVTGIDNPLPLQTELEKTASVKSLKYPDHYAFTENDLQHIHDIFGTFTLGDSALVTTSKDFVRLVQADVNHHMSNFPWYIMEIELKIDRQELFNERVLNYVRGV